MTATASPVRQKAIDDMIIQLCFEKKDQIKHEDIGEENDVDQELSTKSSKIMMTRKRCSRRLRMI